MINIENLLNPFPDSISNSIILWAQDQIVSFYIGKESNLPLNHFYSTRLENPSSPILVDRQVSNHSNSL
jgi:hypothetical protein